MYSVYVLQSELNGRYYIGYTSNINDRLAHHNSGANKSTKPFRPWKLIYQEKFTDKKLAWIRERQVKSYKGGQAFKKLISGGFAYHRLWRDPAKSGGWSSIRKCTVSMFYKAS